MPHVYKYLFSKSNLFWWTYIIFLIFLSKLKYFNGYEYFSKLTKTVNMLGMKKINKNILKTIFCLEKIFVK